MIERSILLIDDDELVLKSMSFILVHEGYKVFIANGVQSGLAMFESGKYPLVITDLTMGEQGGIDVVKRVKEIKPETVVLVISGCGNIGPTVDVMSHGADGYLLKPITRIDLIQKVTSCFERIDQSR